MDVKRLVALGVVLCVSAPLVGCGGGSSEVPVSGGDVDTVLGAMAVEAAQLSDTFVPGCTQGDQSCLEASDGERLLIVWMTSPEYGGFLSVDQATEITGWMEQGGQATIVTDGVKIEPLSVGHGAIIDNTPSSRFHLVFRVDASASGFAFQWPNSALIDLGL